MWNSLDKTPQKLKAFSVLLINQGFVDLLTFIWLVAKNITSPDFDRIWSAYVTKGIKLILPEYMISEKH